MPRNTNHAFSSGVHHADLVNDPSQNQSSRHCYIHPGENPSISLVNPLLNRKNYHTWAKLMKRALISKNKWKFLDRSVPVPDKFDTSHNAWERCNNLIHSWIVNSVSPSIAQSLIHIDLAIVVWRNWKERFSQRDLVRVAELQQELYSFKQCNLYVTDFFTELTVFWEELENYRPVINCNCDSKKFTEQDYVIRFLMGLNEYYSVIKTQVILMDPFPPLNRIFSMILQYGRQNGKTFRVGIPDLPSQSVVQCPKTLQVRLAQIVASFLSQFPAKPEPSAETRSRMKETIWS